MQLFLHLPARVPGTPPETLIQLDLTTDDGCQYAVITTLAQWSRLLAGEGPIEARLADATREEKCE